jgi:hypothetical protein
MSVASKVGEGASAKAGMAHATSNASTRPALDASLHILPTRLEAMFNVAVDRREGWWPSR